MKGEDFLLDELQNQLLPDYQFLLRWLYRASEVSHHLMTLYLFHYHLEARTAMAGKLVETLVETLVANLVVEQVVKLVAMMKLIGLVEVEMGDRFCN